MSVEQIVQSVHDTLARNPYESVPAELGDADFISINYEGYNLGFFMLGVVAGKGLVETGPINVSAETVESQAHAFGLTDPMESIPETLDVEFYELADGLKPLLGIEPIPDVTMGLLVGKSIAS